MFRFATTLFTFYFSTSPLGILVHTFEAVFLSAWCLTVLSCPAAAEGTQPVATVTPSVLHVQQGQRAEFRCTVTGKPTPAIEWIGRTTQNSTAVVLY